MSSAEFETKFIQDEAKQKSFSTHHPVKIHLKNGNLVIFEQGGYLTGGEVLIPNDIEKGVRYFDIYRTEQDWQGGVPISEIAYVQYGEKKGDVIGLLVHGVPIVALPALVYLMLDFRLGSGIGW